MLTYGTDVLLTSRKYAYDPNKGNSIIEIYEGTPTAIAAVSHQITDPYVSWAIDDSEKPKWSLTVQTPDDITYQTIWEVHGNDLSKSIYEHPRTVACGTTEVGLIREYFKHATETETIPAGITSDDGKMVFALLKKDTTHYFLPQYVLRSRIIGTYAGFAGAIFPLSSVGLVFDPAKLLPGGSFDVHMPSQIANFVHACSVVHTESALNYTWGWLCKTPSITGLPGGKFELRQEWWLELWSNLLYDAAA